MKVITLLIFNIISTTYGWNPQFYPYDPRIHNMGNDNTFFSIHSKLAPIFTKYTDATVYGRNLREEIINNEGDKKTILDVGCGTGFSTSLNEGSLGLDTSNEMITMARSLFPKKMFEQGHIEHWIPDKKYDIVTAMFFFHEVPQFARLNIIEKLKEIAKEKVIIVDIAPNYRPNKMMASGEPYIMDYLKNIRKDLVGFSESILQKNHVHQWTYKKNISERLQNIEDMDDIDVDELNTEELEFACKWLAELMFKIYYA
ncbi:MAG: hypothetical protein CMD14_03015 [Flavobacteriales bacterium]|nr:hypothetical protein [Flavobacteriales bacterium]|tara:strand:+ start:3094 stop:3864 length:771 start_codon:yes stop_codon:yes gene_type:complete